jgi:hypothetical protein
MLSPIELGKLTFMAFAACLRRGRKGFSDIAMVLMTLAMALGAIKTGGAVFAKFPVRHDVWRNVAMTINAN